MYIWVILATFFVAIMAKTMTVRDDYINLTVVPKAEGVTINLKIKQDMAINYAYSKTTPFAVTYKNGCIDIAASGCSNVIADTDIPIGFNKDRFGFQSYIFCLNPTNTGVIQDPCSLTTYNYVITHGKVPSNWQDPITKIPKYEFVKAINNVTKSSYAGIVKKLSTPTTAGTSSVIGTEFVVETYRGQTVSSAEGTKYTVGIPRYAINPSCGGFGTSSGVACPEDVIYIQNINQPSLNFSNPLPPPP